MDLRKLNSATKYPSITTYHTLGDRGRLTDAYVQLVGNLVVTEKIDGTNARIILLPDNDYIIGSREDLLHARGDRIFNPAQGIVSAIRDIADRVSEHYRVKQGCVVVYGEVYGGNVTAASKEYGKGIFGFRLFDVSALDEGDFRALTDMRLEQIALWRDNGGQSFASEHSLHFISELTNVALTPRVLHCSASEFPTNHTDVYTWLSNLLPSTHCKLEKNAGGRAEGVVVRTTDRSQIVKIRYEDYERTLRKHR